PATAGRRPGGGRCQSFPPDGWRGDARPPPGNAGGDDHRSHGERAALKEPQPAGVRRSAPQCVQRDDIHEAFLTPACAIICWRRTAEPLTWPGPLKAPTPAIKMATGAARFE